MIIEPKVREYICTTAHPAGCARNVRNQAEYAAGAGPISGPKRVFVIGASAGYGLSARIAAAFGCGADTLGVMLERKARGKRTASAGWYNTAAFTRLAQKKGLYARTINGDAFSAEVKEKALRLIQEEWGTVDLVVYSLASPRRTMADGTVYTSCLKTRDEELKEKSLDLRRRAVVEKVIPPATEEEVQATVKVMGGEDWLEWIRVLHEGGVLAKGAVTIAFSYIGPALTYPIYTEGTIGQAKRHLQETAKRITEEFPGVRGMISVNKAVVTQSGAAIPAVPLYLSILYRLMKEQGTHEDCIRQMVRLLKERLCLDPVPVDEEGRIRMDDLEMEPGLQKQVMEIWEQISTENLDELSDVQGYWEDFYRIFGFGCEGVDYGEDVDPRVEIQGLVEVG